MRRVVAAWMVSAALAAVAAAVVASRAWRVAAPDAHVEHEPEPHTSLRAAFEAGLRAASSSGRDLLIWCRNFNMEDEGAADDRSTSTKARDVLEHTEARRVIDGAFVVVELAIEWRTPTESLPDELRALIGEGVGSAGTEASAAFLPPLVLADAAGRVYAEASCDGSSASDCADEWLRMRSIRERRDAAFARAACTEGPVRARALADGVAAMQPRIALLCYREELAEIGLLDPDCDREEVAALVRTSRALPGVMAAHRAAMPLRSLHELTAPLAVQQALAPVLRDHGTVPEVQQLATWYLAAARARAARDDAARQAVVVDVEAAIVLDPKSEVVPMLEELLALLRGPARGR